jgi:hypothetical protein
MSEFSPRIVLGQSSDSSDSPRTPLGLRSEYVGESKDLSTPSKRSCTSLMTLFSFLSNSSPLLLLDDRIPSIEWYVEPFKRAAAVPVGANTINL